MVRISACRQLRSEKITANINANFLTLTFFLILKLFDVIGCSVVSAMYNVIEKSVFIQHIINNLEVLSTCFVFGHPE